MSKRPSYLEDILKSLKNLRKGLDEDHIYYAGVKRKTIHVANFGNIALIGALLAAPFTGGASLVAAATGVCAIANAPGFATTIAEQSAYRKYLKEAQNALQDYGDYVKILSKSNGWVEGIDTTLLTTLEPLINASKTVLKTACGKELTGDLAMETLKGIGWYAVGPFIIINLVFNVIRYTENGVIIEQKCRTEMSRELGKIIAELEVHYESQQEMPSMSNAQHQHYINVINSLRRLAPALDRDHRFYLDIAKKTSYGNVVSAALFVAGMTLSPYMLNLDQYCVLSVFGAGVWTLSTAVGVLTQVAERSAISKYMEILEKDLQDYMDYLRMSANTEEIMVIVQTTLDAIRKRSTQPLSNIYKLANGNGDRKGDQLQDCAAVDQELKGFTCTIVKYIAPSENLRVVLQSKYGTALQLAIEVRQIINKLEVYYRENH